MRCGGGAAPEAKEACGSPQRATTLPPPEGVLVMRGDGGFIQFNYRAGTYRPSADVPEFLTRSVDGAGQTAGWTYLSERDETEQYDASGRLQSITSRQGNTTTLSYDRSSVGREALAISRGVIGEVARAETRKPGIGESVTSLAIAQQRAAVNEGFAPLSEGEWIDLEITMPIEGFGTMEDMGSEAL